MGDRGNIGVVLVPLVVEQLSGLVVLELEWRKLPPGLITPEVGSEDLWEEKLR